MKVNGSLPAVPFATDWKITENITEEELENLLTDLHRKYEAWEAVLSEKYPVPIYETRKEYLEKATPVEKLQKEVQEIQLSLAHRIIGIRSTQYQPKDRANTVMFLLLLKSHPMKCPKVKEYLLF